MPQVSGFKLPFNRQWGAGVLSVMGVSFTTVSIAIEVVNTQVSPQRLAGRLAALPCRFLAVVAWTFAETARAPTHVQGWRPFMTLRLAPPVPQMRNGDTFSEAYGHLIGTVALW